MKKRFLLGVAVLVMMAAFLAGCTLTGENIAVLGKWIDPSFDSMIIVTNEDILFYWPSSATDTLYECSIEAYDNDKWNAGETGSGSHGYMVLRYTKAPEGNPSVGGQYMILRWKNLSGTGSGATMDYSEGYNVGGYSATAEQAMTDFTGAAGSFGFYTVGTVRQ